MGRIRTIKPEFFTHEGLFDLETETKLPIRVSFSGLWCQCDREGRFKWKPRTLKTSIIPFDNIDFSRVLDALSTRGFIVKYIVENEEYGYIPSFLTHQVINNRESDSILPIPSPDNILTRETYVDNASSTPLVQDKGERKGKERKGKEGVLIEFEVFWDDYDKKVGDKEKLKKMWNSLSDEEQALAISHIKKYKQAQPNKKYRKDPATYLNNKSFNDEIIQQYTQQPLSAILNQSEPSHGKVLKNLGLDYE